LSSQKSLENKLQKFEVKGIGEIYQGSNRVFLCELVNDEEKILSVYKPLKGEKPLVDFFSGNLYSREKAAYEISKFLDWPNLPPLVIREGPYGIGSFQKYIIHDPKENYFTLFESHKENLLKVIVFDFIILNTDRKAGSIILDENENIWSIDQALTFNPYTRFRTVMFEFSNQLIEEKIIQKVKKLSNELNNKAKIFKDLEKLISYEEMDYLITRCEELIKNKKLPILDPNYNVPYPLI
tara:strand:+ start:2154 stop:2870 length:717 start_codon:yes stop_codon:yes gene_type:complete